MVSNQTDLMSETAAAPDPFSKRAIARIYRGNKVIGAGFLVEGGHVLTCAHVVRDALALKSEDVAEGKTLKLNFPYLSLKQKLTAEVLLYRLIRGDEEQNEDIAGLRIVESLPKELLPARLLVSYQLHNPYWVLGFPSGHPKGISSSGQLLQELPNGWVQLEDTKAQGLAILPGFSGTPVWDERSSEVVGMVIAREKDQPEAKIGFMVPARALMAVQIKLLRQNLFHPLCPQTSFPTKLSELDVGIDDVPQDLPFLDIEPVGLVDEAKREKKELEGIHNALQRQGRVLVAGMPGVGKSVLALHYARTHLSDYPGGLFWIDACTEDGEADDIALQLVELAITQGLEVPETVDTSKQLRYCARHWPRAPQPILLVLDNISTVSELQPCLKWLPPERFAFLITGRPQLRLPSVRRVDLKPFTAETAFQVFQSVLPANDERLTGEADEIREFCIEQLGGLPLAVQVMATALLDQPNLSIKELAVQLDDIPNPLGTTLLDDVDMAGMLENVKQSVTAVFEFSWQALSSQGQLLAGLISLFAPNPVPWTLIQEAAKDVPGLGNPAAACAKLQEMSLLSRPQKNTCQIHRLLRAYFQLKAQTLNEFQALVHGRQQAIITRCRKVSERCNQSEADEFMDVEPHVQILLDGGKQSLDIYRALQCVYIGRGLYRKAYECSLSAIALVDNAKDVDVEQLAYFHKQAGERAFLVGMQEAALEHLEQARTLIENQPESQLLVQILTILSALKRQTNQLEAAETTIEQALALRRDLSLNEVDVAEVKMTQITNRFVRALHQGNLARADLQVLATETQAILQVREQCIPDDRGAKAEAMNLLAKIYEVMGERSQAIALYRQAESIAKPPHPNAASARNNLAKALEGVAEEQEVMQLYESAIAIFHGAEVFGDEGWCLHNLGVFHALQGRIKDGIELVERGHALLVQENDPRVPRCAKKLTQLRQCLEIG